MNVRERCPDCDVSRLAHIGDWIDALTSFAILPIGMFVERSVPLFSGLLEEVLLGLRLLHRVWNEDIPLADLVARDRLVVEAFMRAKLPVYVLMNHAGATSHIGVRVGDALIRFDGLPSSEDLGGSVSKLSNSKTQMKAVFSTLSVPVAESKTFWWWQERAARKYAHSLKRIVVKPDAGTMDRHVTIDVPLEEFTSAFVRARRFGPRVLVEAYVPHTVVRVTVVGDNVFAVRYDPPYVIADGVHSVSELVEIENQSPSRTSMTDQTGSKHRILFGEETNDLLRKKGLTLASVPQRGIRVHIRRDPFVRYGSTFTDVTAQLHGSIRDLMARLAKECNAFVLGVDCIAEDISRSIEDQRFVVLEANAVPFIELHATKECPHEIGDAVVRAVLKVFAKEQT